MKVVMVKNQTTGEHGVVVSFDDKTHKYYSVPEARMFGACLQETSDLADMRNRENKEPT